MSTGDAAYIKKINRSFIISKIYECGMVSRADLAKLTGLNKATVSVQVADLLDAELLIETQQEHTNLGRRPIMLSINEQAGYVLGVDVDNDSIHFTLSSFTGSFIENESVNITTSEYVEILEVLAKKINEFKVKCIHTRYGLASVVIGVHGIVNNNESIYFVPFHKWKNKDLKNDLQERTGIYIYVENNANLCALAEKVYHFKESRNLLTVTLHSGIGLGMMVNGELIKGYHGYAGEIGHMIVVPDGKPCSCGNSGCWEQYASEANFVSQLSVNQNPVYQQIQQSLINKDPVTCMQMEQYIKYLSIGINNIINLYNPEVLVINSELLRLYPSALDEIKQGLNFKVGDVRELQISQFGKNSCIMGACALGISRFLEVSNLYLSWTQEKVLSPSLSPRLKLLQIK